MYMSSDALCKHEGTSSRPALARPAALLLALWRAALACLDASQLVPGLAPPAA